MRILKGIFFVTLCGLPSLALALKADWGLKSGTLTYHVHYPLKNVEGKSTNVKGRGHCEAGVCQFLVAVPVKSFESGDGNRDNHMLEVTKAGLFPMVAVKVQFPEPKGPGEILATADVSFAGKSHSYKDLKINFKMNEGRAEVKGQLPLVLSQFEVERPSLLTVKVDDAAPVDFEFIWE